MEGRGGEHKPGSANGPTRPGPPAMVFTPYRNMIDWTIPNIFQKLPLSESSVQRGRRSVGMGKICPNHLSLL